MKIPDLIETQYPEPSGTRCIQIAVPDDIAFLAPLRGFLIELGKAENYRAGIEDDTAQAIAQLWRDAYAVSSWEMCLEQFLYVDFDLWGGDFDVLAGNAIAWTSLPLHEFGGAWNQSAAAIHDYRNKDFYLPAGTYTITVHYVKSGISGKLTVTFAGSALGADIDLYAASNTYNQKTTYTGVTVTSNALWGIGLLVDSKNASSSGYSAYISRVHIERTGA